MEMFTFIGLLLSIFGATYGAVSALRAHFGEEIREKLSAVPAILESIPESAKTHHQQAKRRAKWTLKFIRLWYWAQSIPLVIFAIAAFCLAFYLCWVVPFDGSCKTIQVHGSHMLWLLRGFVILNLICFVVAVADRFVIRFCYGLLDDVQDGYTKSGAQELEKV